MGIILCLFVSKPVLARLASPFREHEVELGISYLDEVLLCGGTYIFKEAKCLSVRPVWPSRYHLPLLGVPTEVGKVARAWLLISLGEIFLLLGPVDVK